MIFDSAQMDSLRKKYQNKSDHLVPEIVLLDRHESCKNEKNMIEHLLSTVAPEKQKDWLGRLVNDNHSQYLGAWFEIMLYEWLQNKFQVEVEPKMEGHRPDFRICAQDKKIVIEAVVDSPSPDEIKKASIEHEFLILLERIQKPIAIYVKFNYIGTMPNQKHFLNGVNDWLDNSMDYPYHYTDDSGNDLTLEIAFETTLNHVSYISGGDFILVDSEPLKNPFHRKLKQRRKLQDFHDPYIIAILLEDQDLSAEEAVEAWLGKSQVIFDIKTGMVIENSNDLSGLSFHNNRIQNREISGILAFTRSVDRINQSRRLHSWYIENPYATNKIDPFIFPAKSRFIVIKKNESSFTMDWVN